MTPTKSYLKVHYELRPAKQVERRMLVDALMSLSNAGFPIRDYQYTGMGSIYFIDFMLFHRVLGISNMLSVEYDTSISRRVTFNRPFECVRTQIDAIGNVIPSLSKDLKHILWLDYDDVLTASHLSDIQSAAACLSVGSLLLATIDGEPPTDTEKPKDWFAYFRKEASDYLHPSLKLKDFAKSSLPRRNADVIHNAIKAGLAGRTNVEFIPMFNFVYRDGHQMLTIGGMIGTKTEQSRVAGSEVARENYFRNSFDIDPMVIDVPRLTRKERQYMDGFMPCEDEWRPPEFELKGKSVLAYREIYRYCPTYAELAL